MHNDTIAVALAEAGKRGEVREHGKVVNTPTALKTLAVKLARNGASLRFCYEAGPCGYGIQRQLSEAGHECVVVAPSLIPRKPGDRVKTDRRDAINLAKLHRAGLSSVWVPDPANEAIRDLVRARLAAVRVVRQARQQLSGFLLRHGHHYNRPAWTLMHRRWLAGLKFEHAAHYIVLEDCIAAVEAATARRESARRYDPSQANKFKHLSRRSAPGPHADLQYVAMFAPQALDQVERRLSSDDARGRLHLKEAELLGAVADEHVFRLLIVVEHHLVILAPDA